MINFSEMQEKERRARELMESEGLDALAISTIANFAWLTCGGSNYVGIATEVGSATAIITRSGKYIVCDNIEAGRLRDEEIRDQGFELISFNWFEPRRDDIIQEIVGDGILGSDIPMPGAKNIAPALDPYRYSLTPEEIERYRRLGRDTGECMAQACREIEQGMTEYEIAGVLNGKLLSRGLTPLVTLIATDERIANYRHPLPTHKKLERYAMLVTGVRRWGLIISTSRLVHFGELPAELRRKHDAVTRIDAAFISATRPGADMGEIFRSAVDTYKSTGYADEWTLHHQGGPTGYKGREFRVTPSTSAAVAPNQAFAWNPSITGTKSEDTIIATPDGPQVLSMTDDWPVVEVELNGQIIPRPDILVR